MTKANEAKNMKLNTQTVYSELIREKLFKHISMTFKDYVIFIKKE